MTESQGAPPLMPAPAPPAPKPAPPPEPELREAEYTPVVGDEFWYDRWQKPDGDFVLLPTTNRTAYQRSGLVLFQGKVFDIRDQMQADASASRWRGTPADANLPTGPTAPFPA